MAWEGKSLGDICRQLKDTKLNGGRDLAMLQEHIAKDDLVAWGWNPGPGRQPAPARRKRRENWFRPGSIPARSARRVRRRSPRADLRSNSSVSIRDYFGSKNLKYSKTYMVNGR